MLFRLAPTPSGFLHTGNACSFLLTQNLARKHNGKILLRIDDLDAERKRREYVEDIFDSLNWLGITWDEGPEHADDFEKNWSQQHRLPLYRTVLQKLISTGDVFACTCSRSHLQTTNSCSCRERNLPLDAPGTALRLFVPTGTIITFRDELLGKVRVDLSAEMGSFVIRKKDTNPAYQLASVADDLHFGVTHVVRGQDLLHSTAAQLYLAAKTGVTSFPAMKFYHHAVLEDEHGMKLSKSAGASSLKFLREKGVTGADFMATLNFQF